MRKNLVLLVFAVVAMFTPCWAFAQDSEQVSLAHHIDLPQLAVETGTTSREAHLTIAGYSISLFRVGNLRFPRVGVDWQLRRRQGSENCDCRKDFSGHWLAVAGGSYILNESFSGAEWNFIFGASYNLRADLERNRLAVQVGFSYVFPKTQ